MGRKLSSSLPWAVQALLCSHRPTRAQLEPPLEDAHEVVRVTLRAEGYQEQQAIDVANTIVRSLMYGLPRVDGERFGIFYSADDIPICGGCK